MSNFIILETKHHTHTHNFLYKLTNYLLSSYVNHFAICFLNSPLSLGLGILLILLSTLLGSLLCIRFCVCRVGHAWSFITQVLILLLELLVHLLFWVTLLLFLFHQRVEASLHGTVLRRSLLLLLDLGLVELIVVVTVGIDGCRIRFKWLLHSLFHLSWAIL